MSNDKTVDDLALENFKEFDHWMELPQEEMEQSFKDGYMQGRLAMLNDVLKWLSLQRTGEFSFVGLSGKEIAEELKKKFSL